MDKPYVYIFVRKDLSLPQQLVQSNHASWEAGQRFQKPDQIASIVMLEVPDKEGLYLAAAHLASLGLDHYMFFEPDFDMGHSAIATGPVYGDARKPLRKYPLYKVEAINA